MKHLISVKFEQKLPSPMQMQLTTPDGLPVPEKGVCVCVDLDQNRNLINGHVEGNSGQVLFSLNNIWASVNATGH